MEQDHTHRTQRAADRGWHRPLTGQRSTPACCGGGGEYLLEGLQAHHVEQVVSRLELLGLAPGRRRHRLKRRRRRPVIPHLPPDLCQHPWVCATAPRHAFPACTPPIPSAGDGHRCVRVHVRACCV